MSISMRHRRHFSMLAVLSVGLVGLVLNWSLSPAWGAEEIGRITHSLQRLGQTLGPVVAITSFSLACVLSVPVTLLTLISIATFGPVRGASYALIGAGIGATISYWVGQALGKKAVQQLTSTRIHDINKWLGQRGILAAFVMRLVPMAPFAILNMIAGVSHIRLRYFLIGSTLGMLPATLCIALVADTLLNKLTS